MKKKWDETTVRYVAFLDIMGFSDLIYRNNHLVVKKKMTKLSTLVDEIVHNGEKELVKSVIFSDSILIISKDDKRKSLESILFTLQNFFTHCLINRIPLKGAVSKGLFTANFKSSLFFGQPIIDAYKLEEELQMYGIILDHQTESKINKYQNLYDSYCLNSLVPTKSGLITHTSINWMFWANAINDIKIHNIINVDDYNGHMKPKTSLNIIKEFYNDMSGYPRKYLDNTIKYITENCTEVNEEEHKSS